MIGEWIKAAEELSSSEKKKLINDALRDLDAIGLTLEQLGDVDGKDYDNLLFRLDMTLLDFSRNVSMLNSFSAADRDKKDGQTKTENQENSIVNIGRFDQKGITFVMPLPPLKKRETRYLPDHASKVLERKLRDELTKHRTVKKPLFNEAEISFDMCYGDDCKIIPDSDNVSVKGVIDALFPDIISSDDLLTLSLRISGKAISGKSYMKVTVLNTGNRPK